MYNIEELGETAEIAADLSGDGRVMITDLVQMKTRLLELEKTQQLFK